jgi:hypothetical protein
MTNNPIRHYIIYLIIFLVNSIIYATAMANFLKIDLPQTSSYEALSSLHFIDPNEQHPVEMLPLLEASAPGVHIALGTERGFIGGALNPNATHLLLIDGDSEIVRYNRINIALLEVARNRQEYLRLRLATTHEPWIQIVSELIEKDSISQEARDILADKGLWQWWHTVRHAPRNVGLDILENEDKARQKGVTDFMGANYLFDDNLFSRLSTMAKQGYMQTVCINLDSAEELEQIFLKIITEITAQKLKLSVFDLSNAWWGQYISKHNIEKLIEKLKLITNEKSIFLLTAGSRRKWHYVGLQFQYILNPNLFVNAIIGEYGNYRAQHTSLPAELNPVSLVQQQQTILQGAGCSELFRP